MLGSEGRGGRIGTGSVLEPTRGITVVKSMETPNRNWRQMLYFGAHRLFTRPRIAVVRELLCAVR